MKVNSGSLHVRVLPHPTVKVLPGAKNKGKFQIKPFQRVIGRKRILAGLLVRRAVYQDKKWEMFSWFVFYLLTSVYLDLVNKVYAHSVDLALDVLLEMCVNDQNIWYAIDEDWVNGWLVMILDIHH